MINSIWLVHFDSNITLFISFFLLFISLKLHSNNKNEIRKSCKLNNKLFAVIFIFFLNSIMQLIVLLIRSSNILTIIYFFKINMQIVIEQLKKNKKKSKRFMKNTQRFELYLYIIFYWILLNVNALDEMSWSRSTFFILLNSYSTSFIITTIFFILLRFYLGLYSNRRILYNCMYRFFIRRIENLRKHLE